MNGSSHDFVRLMIEAEVLQFGDFTLKSGRLSPYFFNLGKMDNARAVTALGKAYANNIVESGIEFDILFGPAYKGIPIAVATAIALYEDHGVNTGITFNRKETKQHGEGGNLIGHDLRGKVLILDDVITAGTAIRESLGLIADSGASLSGVMVAMDRQELMSNGRTALTSMALEQGIPVHSISNLEHVIEYLNESGQDGDMLDKLKAHRAAYC
jgi:orotate phosphoribosyltransferase